MEALLRLLELVKRELSANDAHVRLGGRPDGDPRVLEYELRPGCRVVVRFDEPPADPEPLVQRLAELAWAFIGTVDEAIDTIDTSTARPRGGHALIDTLADLRDATEAAVALVIDRQSPMIWGCSEPGLGLGDRPAARRLAAQLTLLRERGLDPVLEASAIEPRAVQPDGLEQVRQALQDAERNQPGGAARLAATTRALCMLDQDESPVSQLPEGDEPGIATKGFGGLYRVVLVFIRPFSPLRVEGVLRRALPIIERLVLELPPLEPPPKGGRVVPLHRD